MKKLIITAAVLAATKISNAQFSVQVNYGYRNPVGTGIRQAFDATNGFSVTALRTGKNDKWAYGISFNRQSFASSAVYFSKDYTARFKNSNLLFSLQKEYRVKTDHRLYWGIDAGLGINRYMYNKAGIRNAFNANAFVTGFLLGADWCIMQNFSLNIQCAYHRMQMDPVNFDDRLSSSRFKTVSLDAGIKYRFGK